MTNSANPHNAPLPIMNPPLSSDSASHMPGRVAAHHPPQRSTPAVPISIYRELAAELQSTKAVVDTLRLQNEHLVRQNHQLRQEIQNFVQFSVQLGNMTGFSPRGADGQPPSSPGASALSELSEFELPTAPTEPKPKSPRSKSKPEGRKPESAQPKPRPAPDDFGGPSNPLPLNFPKVRESLYTEQPQGPKRSLKAESTQERDLSTLWLVLSIIVIVSTAFGAGFLIMKPLMNNR
ncbi:MAG: hypothetical protein AAF728_09455 [Cyanobacteria bacterium P01_D01_bin.128]